MANGDQATLNHVESYPRFLLRALRLSTDGDWRYYTWMTLLTAVALVGLHAWAVQVRDGMIVTHMTDQVTWGLYIANFTVLAGLAAGSIMMVIAAYLYRDQATHDVVFVAQLLAIAAVVMCILFVSADIGRPDRAWHLVPLLGRFNWPGSMLTWDVLVLNGFLLINLHICGYLLYRRYLGRRADRRWYLPFVFLSIVWAISIRAVTAFLYAGLGGRPFWNSAMLAPGFLASAFVSGPCVLICTLALTERFGGLRVGAGPVRTLVNIVRVAIVASLVMLASELFTELYTGGSHTSGARYLILGLHGDRTLVPWFWAGVGLNLGAATLFLWPNAAERRRPLYLACAMALLAVWIAKGPGLIIPGLVPSPLHEVVSYTPSLIELQVSAGILAFGLLVYTASLKIAVPIFQGQAKIGGTARYNRAEFGLPAALTTSSEERRRLPEGS